MSELFHLQFSRWRGIAEDHLATLYDEITVFVKAALGHITKDEQVFAELVEIISLSLKESKQSAEKELEKLCQDE